MTSTIANRLDALGSVAASNHRESYETWKETKAKLAYKCTFVRESKHIAPVHFPDGQFARASLTVLGHKEGTSVYHEHGSDAVTPLGRFTVWHRLQRCPLSVHFRGKAELRSNERKGREVLIVMLRRCRATMRFFG